MERALTDLDVMGRRLDTPGLCSRMSNTAWPAGLRPVMNVGHAVQECEGTVERQSPYAPRSMSAARLGNSPRSSIGWRTFQSTPSHPIIATRCGTQGRLANGRAFPNQEGQRRALGKID